MGRDTVFGDIVHAPRADLQLDALARRADDRGVDRLIVVLLRRRDVVLEATWNNAPAGVHDAERPVAGRDVIDDDAETPDVGKLFEGQRLRLHLAEDRIGLLLAALDLRSLQAFGLKQFAQLVLDLLDQTFVALGKLFQSPSDRLESFRVDVAEREIFELFAHILHTHAAGERRIDIHRFFGDAGPLFRRHVVERAHVVQPVGKLDQKHTHVVRDRQQQFAQVLSLLGLLGDEIELLDLRQPLDERTDVFAEEIINLLAGRGRVFDRVVQQRDRNGRLVEPHFRQDRSHFQGMRDIGIAACPLLLAMLLHRIDVGLVQQGFIDVGLVFLHALNELVLAHHSLAVLWIRVI